MTKLARCVDRLRDKIEKNLKGFRPTLLTFPKFRDMIETLMSDFNNTSDELESIYHEKDMTQDCDVLLSESIAFKREVWEKVAEIEQALKPREEVGPRGESDGPATTSDDTAHPPPPFLLPKLK